MKKYMKKLMNTVNTAQPVVKWKLTLLYIR